MNKLKLNLVSKIEFFRNNKINITLTKNAKCQHEMKYIDMQYHYIKELIIKKKLSIKWVNSFKMPANEMIKALLSKIFQKH